MTIQEAIKILHPESSFEALLGCTREEGLKIVEEACLMACEALKKTAGIERVLERLEEEGKLADEEKERCARENHLQFDRAVGYSNGIFNAIEIIKEEVG